MFCGSGGTSFVMGIAGSIGTLGDMLKPGVAAPSLRRGVAIFVFRFAGRIHSLCLDGIAKTACALVNNMRDVPETQLDTRA
jgi:hypothetical protein